MRVEGGYHTLGCGALNDTGPCSCGPGWTPEAISRQASQQTAQKAKENGVKLSMTKALSRQNRIARELKGNQTNQ